MVYNDVFNEQLVKKETTVKDNLIKLGIGVGFVAIFMLLSTFEFFVGIMIPVLFLFIFLAWFVIKRMNVEFEYIFTNGDIDIDKISDRTKRKHLLTIDSRTIEKVVSMKNQRAVETLGSASKTYDVSSGKILDNTYCFICESEGKKIKIIFEPNEKMYHAIKSYNPKAFREI